MNDIVNVDYNLIASVDFTLEVDGITINSSDEYGPIVYLHGHNNIIPGLERALYGMFLGESKSILVAPQEAYGDFDPDAFSKVPLHEFDNGRKLVVGSNIEMEDEDGKVMIGAVLSIDDTEVKLDFNHPLAGKELNFEVKITALRQATVEELELGYPTNDQVIG